MRLHHHLLLPLLPLAALAASIPEARLQELLRQYPAADTNGDGVLSPAEAQAHAQKLRGKGKAGGRANSAAAIDEGLPDEASRTRKPPPTHADVSYGPHERHKLDLWLASAATPTPLVVFIHGGGFVNGSKAGANADMINGCLEAGVSFMAINYRFRASAPIQDILRDCARSLQFLRSRAGEYRIDPARIAAYGGSAGAGSSLWLAFHPDLAEPGATDPVLRQSSRVVAAGAINTQATYNLRRWPEVLGVSGSDHSRPGEAAAFYGLATDEEVERATAILADVDMLGLISRDDPPVFLYTRHPDGDIGNRGHLLHHPRHARAVQQACSAAGVPATAWFAAAVPRMEGDYLAELRKFLLTHLRAR